MRHAENLKLIPFVCDIFQVLANKQDLPNALRSYEIVDKMGLRELRGNPWHVQEMCAITGDGLYEGIQKMAEMVKTFQKGRK